MAECDPLPWVIRFAHGIPDEISETEPVAFAYGTLRIIVSELAPGVKPLDEAVPVMTSPEASVHCATAMAKTPTG